MNKGSYITFLSVLVCVPSLNLDGLLGQPDHAFDGVEVGRVAGVEDLPDLELLACLRNVLCLVYRELIAEDRQPAKGMLGSQLLQELDELAFVN